MAKLTRKQLEAVVAKEAPGYQIARPATEGVDAQSSRAPAEGSTPDLEQMQRKLGARPSRGNPGPGAADAKKTVRTKAAPSAKQAKDDTQIVALEPKTAADPWTRAARPKSIVVSGDGKVIGRQG